MDNSLQNAEQTIKSLLVGSQFESFTFHTHFILFFARNVDSRTLKEDCYSVKIEILSDWIFGSEEEWEKCKTKFDLSNCIEENDDIMDFAWIIEDSTKNQDNDWSIVAEFKEIYAKF